MIETITVTEWNQLLDLEPEFGGWVYRGHSDASWELETSLRRIILNNQKGYGSDSDFFAFGERASLKTFRARAHFYLNHLPNSEDNVGWLAVMQHHGTPTRLLDFSYSLYVACYFALINAVGDACVWAISDHWLMDQGSQYADKLGFKATNSLRFGALSSIYHAANSVVSANSFDAYSYKSPKKSVLMIEIEKQIPRLAVQQGIFLMPTDLDATFMGNLLGPSIPKSKKSAGFVKRILLPWKIRSHALMHLRTMNITAETLFPGIDGFAASIIQHDML